MDQQSLERQYSTGANLAARIELHRRCSTNPYGFQRWVFDRLELAPGQRVLELGCGTGELWRENRDRVPRNVRLVLSDFSFGMLWRTGNPACPLLPDRQDCLSSTNCALPDLPFASDTFDLVIANHMLYHVADRERGLREIRRVLRGGGRLFASTNGESHLRELKELMREFGIEGTDVSISFTMENGEEQLRRVFGNVQRDEYPDSLRVTDPELLVQYIESISGRTPDVRGAIESRMARDGAFHVVKSTGAFVAFKE